MSRPRRRWWPGLHAAEDQQYTLVDEELALRRDDDGLVRSVLRAALGLGGLGLVRLTEAYCAPCCIVRSLCHADTYTDGCCFCARMVLGCGHCSVLDFPRLHLDEMHGLYPEAQPYCMCGSCCAKQPHLYRFADAEALACELDDNN